MLSRVWIPRTHLLRVLKTFVSGFHNQVIPTQKAEVIFCQWVPQTNVFWSLKWIALIVAGFQHLSVDSAVNLSFLSMGFTVCQWITLPFLPSVTGFHKHIFNCSSNPLLSDPLFHHLILTLCHNSHTSY